MFTDAYGANIFGEFYFESRGASVCFSCSCSAHVPDAVTSRVAAVLRFPVYGREERTYLTVGHTVFK